MRLFHQVIADNARRYPTKPAVILDGHATSYRELQRRVGAIASLLPRSVSSLAIVWAYTRRFQLI